MHDGLQQQGKTTTEVGDSYFFVSGRLLPLLVLSAFNHVLLVCCGLTYVGFYVNSTSDMAPMMELSICESI